MLYDEIPLWMMVRQDLFGPVDRTGMELTCAALRYTDVESPSP